MVSEFEATMPDDDISSEHHEQAYHVQASFAAHVKALVNVIEGMGNPFLEDSDDLLALDSKDVKDACVINTVKIIRECGSEAVQGIC